MRWQLCVSVWAAFAINASTDFEACAKPPEEVERLSKAAAPEPGAVVAANRDRLLGSLERLDSFLSAGGSGVHHGWSDLLDFPRLKAELARPQPDRDVLASIAERFRQNYRGLERAEFLKVRSELHNYITALDYARSERPQELYGQRIAELQDCLGRLDATFDEGDAHRAGEIVSWLESLSPQGDLAADAVRRQYCRVNGVAIASGRTANMLLERKVEEQNFITDTILGAFTQGPVYVNGHVTVGVVPSTKRSCLEIRVNGLILAPATVAQRRNVTVHSTSQTSLTASKQVFLNDDGVAFLPATATAASSMQLQDVVAPRRFVERIAWRRASELLPQAEATASRRAESEGSAKLDDQASSMLAGMNDMVCEQLRAPLTRLDAFPRTHFSSDESHFRVAISQWNRSQLAPALSVPEFPADYDLALGAHESMVNNLTESLLGGENVRDEDWRRTIELMTGHNPRPLWVHERSERWTTTLAKERPILSYFENGQLEITLRLSKLCRGERTTEHPMEITAAFSLEISDRDGPYLVRKGEPEIHIAPGLESEVEATLRKFLAQKFGAIFPAELYFDGFVAPAGGTIGRLRALQVVEFNCQKGWLTLGYKITSSNSDRRADSTPRPQPPPVEGSR